MMALHFFRSLSGPSPGCSSRGKKQKEGPKTRRGEAHFKNSVLDVFSNQGAKHEMGGGHHCPPAGDDPVLYP